MTAPLSEREHIVYRAYGQRDVLLYVGCSANLDQRLAEHRAMRAEWLRPTLRLTVEPHPDRESARAAEKFAIETERPLFNEVHNRVRRFDRGEPVPVTIHTGDPYPARTHCLFDGCTLSVEEHHRLSRGYFTEVLALRARVTEPASADLAAVATADLLAEVGRRVEVAA